MDALSLSLHDHESVIDRLSELWMSVQTLVQPEAVSFCKAGPEKHLRTQSAQLKRLKGDPTVYPVPLVSPCLSLSLDTHACTVHVLQCHNACTLWTELDAPLSDLRAYSQALTVVRRHWRSRLRISP